MRYAAKITAITLSKLKLRWVHFWLGGIGILLGIWLSINTLTLLSRAESPIDAFFVLGGSIRRELYVAQLAKNYPQMPILISQGSKDPCIWLIFNREKAPLERVVLEKCANSTFSNFYYGLPILQKWGVRKVKLITSSSHLPRAEWMAKIILGASGIWVEPDIVIEQGIPGNGESLLKTGLDLTRSLLWAVLSQVYQPNCPNLAKLADVDMQYWQDRGFHCEHQANL